MIIVYVFLNNDNLKLIVNYVLFTLLILSAIWATHAI